MTTAPVFHWGLIGPGGIARRFAAAVAALPGTRLHSVHARNPRAGQVFADTWQEPGAPAIEVSSDLQALLHDPAIDGIYIATPHDSHAAFAQCCLAAGKPVLCEKPLTATLCQTEAVVAAARTHGVFLMEALWTRFLPLYAQIAPWLQEGRIGRVQHIQSTFCFAAPWKPEGRLFNPALAGGALLDIGIYSLATTRWVLEQALGACPEPREVTARARLAPTGVEQRVATTLQFDDELSAQLLCGLDGHAPNALTICGTRGYIVIAGRFWQGTRASLWVEGVEVATLHAPFLINGFEGEILEAMHCIRAGRPESTQMPLAESLALARWLQQLRDQLGLRFPFEA